MAAAAVSTNCVQSLTLSVCAIAVFALSLLSCMHLGIGSGPANTMRAREG